jgi:signal transduction histidine kinase
VRELDLSRPGISPREMNAGTTKMSAEELEVMPQRECLRLLGTNQMVGEFLELDHVENMPAAMQVGPVDLNAVIRGAVDEVKQGTDGMKLTAMLDPNLAVMLGDEARLAELVRLLLNHAVRHSPDGGQIVVSSRTHVGQIEVSVMDHGIGVRADFDNPLFSGDDLYSTNPIRRVVGTGLGLGIARQIVALHGGRIWMDRLDGIGSEAHVTFPLDMTARTGGESKQSASAKAS